MGQLLQSRRVLVVDDNADAADLVAALLEAHGHFTATAYGGQDALDVAECFAPDVVFLDINMPGMDGYQAATLFRQRPVGARAKLVALTALSDATAKARIASVGFDAHLIKPASLESLLGVFN